MKFEANWKYKSLDGLEKTNWGDPKDDSRLVTTIHRLRTLPLNEFEIEDLRLMIGQNIGIRFLLPIAVEQLSKNLFAEGDLYEGDLLQAVLNIEHKFWKEHPELWEEVNALIRGREDKLEGERIKSHDFQKFNANS